jgi:hypothetical protein
MHKSIKKVAKLYVKELSKLAIDAKNIEEHIAGLLKTAITNSGLLPKSVNNEFAGIDVYITASDVSSILNWAVQSKLNLNIEVYFEFDPMFKSEELKAKYKKNIDNIKEFLTKHHELFPSKYNNETVDYDNFKCSIHFNA